MPEDNGQTPKITSSTRRARPGVAAAVDSSLRRVVEHPTVPRQLWHIVQMVIIGMRKAQIPRMAAALSYRTIFGLIPVLVVGLVFLAAFTSPEVLSARINNLLDFAGLKQITVQDHSTDISTIDEMPDSSGAASPAALPAHAAVEEDGRAASERSKEDTLARAQRLDEWIERLVRHVQRLPPGTLSIIGLLTLIYGAISMLVEIEKTFNQVYMAPRGRSWVRRVGQYWAVLTLGTIGLVATFTTQQYLMSFVEGSSFEFLSEGQAVLISATQILIPAVISTLLLVFMYMTVPNTRVQVSPALIGAALAALLWETGKFGFRKFAEHSVGYSTLYGPIALLPLFLLWVYITWIIVLCGLQISYALQTYTTAKAQGLTRSVLETLGLVGDQAEQRRTLVVDPAAALVVMAVAAERFRAGKTSDHSQINDATGIDERVISEILEHLAGAGLLHRIGGGADEGGYTLSRPPEAIRAADALRVGEELNAIDRGRAPRLLGELAESRLKSLEDRTVAELIGELRPAAPAPVAS